MIQWTRSDGVVRRFENGFQIRRRRQFLQIERIRYEDDSKAFQGVEVLTNSGRPRQRQFTSSPVQSHRRQQTRKAVEMVSVQMSNEYRCEPVGAQACPRDLSLRSFATIKQQPLSFAGDCQRAHVAFDGRFPELVPSGITLIALTISFCSNLRQDDQHSAAADFSVTCPKKNTQIGSATRVSMLTKQNVKRH